MNFISDDGITHYRFVNSLAKAFSTGLSSEMGQIFQVSMSTVVRSIPNNLIHSEIGFSLFTKSTNKSGMFKSLKDLSKNITLKQLRMEYIYTGVFISAKNDSFRPKRLITRISTKELYRYTNTCFFTQIFDFKKITFSFVEAIILNYEPARFFQIDLDSIKVAFPELYSIISLTWQNILENDSLWVGDNSNLRNKLLTFEQFTIFCEIFIKKYPNLREYFLKEEQFKKVLDYQESLNAMENKQPWHGAF
jgi:hypothetical protein